MASRIENVGAQDPELRNSPVAWETDEDSETLREQSEGEPECFFNDKAYGNGTIVRSGTEMLRCDLGVWVLVGSSDPENP